MLTRESIIQTLQTYFADKPVKRVWLFGSWARGEADAQSDVDVLVDWDYPRLDPYKYFLYPDDLGKMLNCKVDVVSENGVRPSMKQRIMPDLMLVYESSQYPDTK